MPFLSGASAGSTISRPNCIQPVKAVLIASSSPLQQALISQFRQRGRACEVIAPDQLAAVDGSRLHDGIVIEASSLAAVQAGRSVDLAAGDRRRLMELCDREAIPFMLLSDGRVFDGGEAPLNHRENEPPHPASVAGGQLSALEAQLTVAVQRHVILRTGALFSEAGDNFLTRLFAALIGGQRLTLSTTLKSCPTHEADLARVVSGMVDQYSCEAQCWGVYHYNSFGHTTAYEFAEVVYAHVSQRVDLGPANPRLLASETGMKLEPAVPVLRCDKILQHFGIKQLPWRSFLPGALEALCEGEKMR